MNSIPIIQKEVTKQVAKSNTLQIIIVVVAVLLVIGYLKFGSTSLTFKTNSLGNSSLLNLPSFG